MSLQHNENVWGCTPSKITTCASGILNRGCGKLAQSICLHVAVLDLWVMYWLGNSESIYSPHPLSKSKKCQWMTTSWGSWVRHKSWLKYTEIHSSLVLSTSQKIVGFINVWKGLSSFHPVHFVQGQLHQSAYLIFVHFWTPASGRKVELCWVPLLARESARGSRGIESCFFLMQMWLQQVYLPDEMNGPFIFVHQSSWMRGRSTYLSTHSGEMVT